MPKQYKSEEENEMSEVDLEEESKFQLIKHLTEDLEAKQVELV
eukprot:CAMPEP_0170547740 /NCGR_PEP_ID=MMETSP0211-20121228/6083_1 /TAXON_ID=311385 /ORGANISM="Pseudokeronopsis sp., Strain OXSARD2" /LENGTH=42 /DNA_ID= /DNA_START= /DNA_END= /DNA_ORIENTATION=